MKTVVPMEKVDGIVIGVVRPKSVYNDMTSVPFITNTFKK